MLVQNYLSWNIRGASSSTSRFLIRQLVNKVNPSVIFIQETKCSGWDRPSILSLGLGANVSWVEEPPRGLSGGILTVWKDEVFELSSYQSSRNWIMVRGSSTGMPGGMVLINVYAPQSISAKKEVWETLVSLISSLDEKYIMLVGDFNAVRSKEERSNGSFRQADANAFNQFISSTGLCEVNLINSDFTWYGPDARSSKLDRFFLSSEWLLEADWMVYAEHRKTSDHRPLILKSAKNDWGPKPFKFFNFGLKEVELIASLQRSWSQSASHNMIGKFRELREAARCWNNKKYGNINSRIEALEKDQNTLDEGGLVSSGRAEIMVNLEKLYTIKSSMLCQKARVDWQLHGERNTRFFHKALAKRRKSNNILSLCSGDSVITSIQEIKNTFLHHFKGILAPKKAQAVFGLPVGFLSTLSLHNSSLLVNLFSEHEVYEALKDSDPNKAPGPDGMNAGVLKALWDTIKIDVMQFFQDFYDLKQVPKGYNSSFIALIPKKINASLPGDYRPISLMNSAMKLLTKVLSRRLKLVMPMVVSQVQSAFIRGRQITDSIMLANEVVSALQDGKSKGIVLKIDFEKAFDRVSWEYVYEVLRIMNFDSRWISWVRELFCSSKISVLVNGSPGEEFAPTRGLRQGDPLSPLLFNLVGETLAALLKKASLLRLTNGVLLPNSTNPITHLQFADDVILFIQDDFHSIIGIKRVLQCFQILSGFKINFQKSSLYAFGNSRIHLKEWAEILGCKVDKGPINYLGAVLGANPRNVRFWDPLVSKFINKLNSYEAEKISLAGKMVLLRAAIDSTPLYWFSLFKIPATVANKLDQNRRSFLWGRNKDGGNKLHLLCWDKICTPKDIGGLGITSIRLKNLAILAKWIWKAYADRGSMLNNCLSMRYGKAWNYDLSLLESKKCSPVVRQIVSLISDQTIGAYLTRDNFKWYVRDGATVYFWEDWWVGNGTLQSLLPSLYAKVRCKHIKVKNFMSAWQVNCLNAILWVDNNNLSSQHEFFVLVQLLDSVSLSIGSDVLVWLPGKATFSSKVCLDLIKSSNSADRSQSYIWRMIWKIKAPPKILAFLWKLQWNILPTRLFISYRIPGVSSICPWCEEGCESIHHIFWECTLAQWGWNYLGKWWNISGLVHRRGIFSLSKLLNLFAQASLKEIWKLIVAAVLWTIWLARNDLIFGKHKIQEKCFVNIIHIRIDKWGSAAGLMDFGADPLWRVNPSGAVAIRHHKILNTFWRFKRDQFDYVAAVDGAWGLADDFSYKGGIGGYLQDSSGKLVLIFSGPVNSISAQDTEVEAILFLINWMINLNLDFKRAVICSDSSVVVNAFNEGISVKFPVQALDFSHQMKINSSIFIQFVPRNLNERADELAKKGIHRSNLLQKVVGSSISSEDLHVSLSAGPSSLESV